MGKSTIKTGNIWILNGTTPSTSGFATWDEDARISSSYTIAIQIKNSDGNFYQISQDSARTSVGVNAFGTPRLYFNASQVTSDWFNKPCRAIMYYTGGLKLVEPFLRYLKEVA